MARWTPPSSSAAERARALHEQTVGATATGLAHAPATWVLIGEHTDYYGGLAVVGLMDLQVAAATSPRKDNIISVTISHGDEIVHHETSLDELSELAAAQQPQTDSDGKPVLPPAPTGGVGQRAAGMVWAMMGRQMLSRDTTGYSITVVSDIPPQAGLGASYSMDAAIALALAGGTDSHKEALLRTRLADICNHVVTLFAQEPPLRARHTAALRGAGDTISIIDYADGSITQAPHPLTKNTSGFILKVPGKAPDSTELIRARQQFVAEASHAFGADNLRLLPDNSQRVLDWLTAFHKVNGPAGKPSIEEGRNWLHFFEEETKRTINAVRCLRSRKNEQLYNLIASSAHDVESVFGLDASSNLVELARARGAVSARSSAPGMAHAVLALVPAQRAANFAADLSADGIEVYELNRGEISACDLQK